MRNYPLWKIFLIIIVIIGAIIFSLPTIISQDKSNNWFLDKKVNLGLDLQGGSHLLLEVKNDILLNIIEEENTKKSFLSGLRISGNLGKVLSRGASLSSYSSYVDSISRINKKSNRNRFSLFIYIWYRIYICK